MSNDDDEIEDTILDLIHGHLSMPTQQSRLANS